MVDRSPNYDVIASTYDERYRGGDWAGFEAVVQGTLERHASGRVLEVGCGTGHWLTMVPTGVRRHGLDRSLGMLRRAREILPAARLIQGEAAALPYRDLAFDLILCVNALHHFPSPRSSLRESLRVLGRHGNLLLIGMDAHDPELEWYIYRFFPGVREVDLQRHPSWVELEDWLVQDGHRIQERGVAQELRKSYQGEEVLQDPSLSRQARSQIALLGEKDYRRGLAALRQAAREEEEPIFRVRLDINFLLVGKDPS